MLSKKIVHIGVGPWGQNYLKTYREFPITVNVATRDSWRTMIEERPDGVVICTPPQTHVEIAQFALERDIPVMIEKPLALSLLEAEKLRVYTAPILVDHIYLFSDGYQTLKRNVEGKHVQCVLTVGTGTKRHEGYSVLWDYGAHDISMILDLMGCIPNLVSAKEVLTATGSVFEMKLHFNDIITQSRFGVDTKRERKISVQYEDGETTFEDTGNETPVPLYNAIEVFLAAIAGKSDQRLGLELTMRVLRVLEACERSLHADSLVKY